MAMIVDLDSQNFLDNVVHSETNEVIGDKPWFIEFYSPDCPHCQEFALTWAAFDDFYFDQVQVARVNCRKDDGYDLCSMFGIKTIPSLMYLPTNGQKYHKYDEPVKDLTSLENFTLGSEPGW